MNPMTASRRPATALARNLSLSLTLALAAFVPAAGCGGGGDPTPIKVEIQHQEVKGKVLLPNGKPLTRGRVVLTPLQEPKLSLFGRPGPDGTFTLSPGLGVGVTHGDFQVTVEPEPTLVGGRGKKALPYPAKYLDSATSPLKVTITAETRQLPTIELK
jgi:hypothetical protein